MVASRLASPEAIEGSGLIHRLAEPSDRLPAPYLTLLMVHGRAGTAEVMWPFSRGVAELGPLIVAPQAPFADSIGGYSWWAVEEEQGGPTLTQLDQACARLSRFVDSLPGLYAADPKRIVAIGFSQGGVAIGSLLLRDPSKFSAAVILAGFLPSVARTAFDSQKPLPPVFIAHGRNDQTIPVRYAEQSRDFCVEHGAVVTYVEDETGHKVGSRGMKALGQWLTQRLK